MGSKEKTDSEQKKGESNRKEKDGTGRVVNSDAIKVLAQLLTEENLSEIEYQVGSLRMKVSRSMSSSPGAPFGIGATSTLPSSALQYSSDFEQHNVNANVKGNDFDGHPGTIEAQMVGTIYLSPGPNASPFIAVGDTVSQGQTLFIIEAMKVMNMIKAPRAGVVKHIFVKDSQPVEYGDPIVIID